jgi:photosystem II stability/assembly factor-like uncharacterized protein
MRLFTRSRLIAAGFILAFVGVFAGLGAVSRSSPTTIDATAAQAVPPAAWYWTMAVSPSDPDVLVLGTSTGLYRSGDRGKTWKPTGPKGVHATSLADSGDSIFMGGVASPRPAPVIRKGKDRVAPDGPAVLAESVDGGETWRVLHPRGLPNVSIQALAVEPEESSALYLLLNTGALYRSTDGARTFQLVSSKLGVPPWALALTKDGRFVAGDMDSGHYLSPNGKKWQRARFKDAKGGRMVMEYAVRPGDSTRVLMSEFGIVISTDGGRTWRNVLKTKTDVMFGPVAWAPSDPDIAYAVGFDPSLWRSDDGGESWTKVS